MNCNESSMTTAWAVVVGGESSPLLYYSTRPPSFSAKGRKTDRASIHPKGAAWLCVIVMYCYTLNALNYKKFKYISHEL